MTKSATILSATNTDAVGETIMAAVEKTKSKENETASEKSEAVFIYVGPTTKILTKYASFIGGLPPHMKEHFEACKVLEKLFIDPRKFAEFEQQLKDANSVERMLYDKAYQYFSEVK